MALPPTIPTSFVPHPSSATRRFRADYTSAFAFLAYFLLVLALLGAVGVFAYGRILASEQSSKEATLSKEASAIDPATVEDFIRLRDRLSSGVALLDSHIALSDFFDALEAQLPSHVRLSGLQLAVDNAGAVELQATGVATSFNALAAASQAFGQSQTIKDAIFSDIAVNSDGSVSFGLSGTVNTALTTFSATSAAPTPTAPAASASTTSP